MERPFDWASWVLALVFLSAVYGLVYGLPDVRPPAPQSQAVAARPQAPTADEVLAQISPEFVGEARFREWTLICQLVDAPQAADDPAAQTGAAPGKSRVCRVNHVLRSPTEPGSLVAGINVFRAVAGEQPQSILLVRLPPTTQQGEVTFLVDANDGFKAPIARCTANECLLQTVVSDAFIRQMAEGAILRFIVPVAEGKSRFDVPLEGFAKAHEGLGRAVR